MTPTPESQQAALKPCPFCGGEAKHIYTTVPLSKWRHHITCTSTACGMEGPIGSSKSDAINLWNTRTTAPVDHAAPTYTYDDVKAASPGAFSVTDALRAHPAGGVSEINPLALAQDYERRLDLDKDWFTSREEKKAKHMREALRAAGIGAGVVEDVDQKIERLMRELIKAVSETEDGWLSEVTADGWNVHVENAQVYSTNEPPERPDDGNE